MSEPNDNSHLNYIKAYVVPEILTKLPGETLLRCELEHASGLDGFMSALYNIKLHTQTADGFVEI